MYYEDHGHLDSYPLILIHPIGGNVLIWEYEISLLLKNGFRIIAYEIRGHHRTNMGKSNAYAMQDLADDLGALLTHLDIRRCTIIGHSIGGIIGSIYAAQNPEKVDGLVLINSSPKKFQDFDLEKHFKTRAIAITRGIEALAEHKLKSFDEFKDLAKEKRYSDFFKNVFTKTSVGGFVAATVALYSIPEDAARKLRMSGCRVLAIVGSDDSAFIRLSKETKEMMPEMELKVIEGSDHWVIIEKPKEMYDILMGFLGKIIGVSKS
ncbi:alpha/beta fold hydrolase [Candidatus Nitrososphaera evergladensis]|uniref:alpha/beta fold hydrolase n=1 Tax=Candidatus Nitrososphaera evergladensis TaxID=1459637 RepID=UPI00130E6081|nr:alpha/beta hydrolase [Candidatus Nitrososphaera evergladensis]